MVKPATSQSTLAYRAVRSSTHAPRARRTGIAMISVALHFIVFSHANAQSTDTVVIDRRAEVSVTTAMTPLTAVFDRGGKPYLYLAAKAGGLVVFDISAPGLLLPVDTVTVRELGDLEAMNVTQQGALLYVALGNFFGTPGQTPGLAIIDVSDPSDPTVASRWAWPVADKGAAVVAVRGRYAFLGAMTQGLLVLDVSDPSRIAFVSQFVPDPNFPKPNPGPTEKPNARGIAVSDTLVYLCYDAGGLRVVSIADPRSPNEIGRYLNAGVPGKQQAYNNVALHGTTAYVGIDFCGMEILDISDPRHITQRGWWNPWQCQTPSTTWFNSPGHVNQVERDSASGLLFLSSGGSEVSVVDASQPSQPRRVGYYDPPANNQGAWGVGIRGKQIAATYINALIPFFSTWAGVRLFEWTKIATGVEIASSTPGMEIWPSPSTNGITVRFTLSVSGPVRITLSDPLGRVVGTIVDAARSIGIHEIAYDPPADANGVHFLRMAASGVTMTRRVLFLKAR